MATHSEAVLNRRFVEFVKLLDVYLNHFPRHEKYALSQHMRQCAYDVFALIQEAQKRYTKKTTLTSLDIRRFFYRIDREVLRRQLARHIKDKAMLDLMMLFTDHGEPRGIPIGNLLSQLYALVYLSPMDHYIKRELGARWYCRYVDDFVLFGLTHDQALAHRAAIVQWLDQRLGLELSKSRIAKTKRGINFVGYRTWAGARFVRRRCLGNYRQALRADRPDRITSLLAHARHTHSHRYLAAQLETHHAAL